jgi:hypothetical protein
MFANHTLYIAPVIAKNILGVIVWKKTIFSVSSLLPLGLEC